MVKCIPNGTGAILSDSGLIAVTKDRGQSWECTELGFFGSIDLVVTADSAVFVLVDSSMFGDGCIAVSNDYGKSFQTVTKPMQGGSAMEALSRNVIFYNAYSSILRTRNGGQVGKPTIWQWTSTSICRGGLAVVRTMPLDGVPPFLNKWIYGNGDEIPSSITDSYYSGDWSIGIRPPSDTTIKFIVTDARGASDTSFYKVRVRDIPRYKVLAPETACEGSIVQISTQLMSAGSVTITPTTRNVLVVDSGAYYLRFIPQDASDTRIVIRIEDPDGVCKRDTSLIVDIHPRPNVSIREQPKGVLDALYDFPTSRADFQWFEVIDSTWNALQFENKAQYYPTKPGRYAVEVSDASTGCASRSAVLSYGVVSVPEGNVHSQLSIHASYSPKGLVVSWSSSIASPKLYVYDIHGISHLTYELHDWSGSIYSSDMPLTNGVYVFVLRSGNQTETCTVIK